MRLAACDLLYDTERRTWARLTDGLGRVRLAGELDLRQLHAEGRFLDLSPGAGSVEVLHETPRHMVLKARADRPSLLDRRRLRLPRVGCEGGRAGRPRGMRPRQLSRGRGPRGRPPGRDGLRPFVVPLGCRRDARRAVCCSPCSHTESAGTRIEINSREGPSPGVATRGRPVPVPGASPRARRADPVEGGLGLGTGRVAGDGQSIPGPGLGDEPERLARGAQVAEELRIAATGGRRGGALEQVHQGVVPVHRRPGEARPSPPRRPSGRPG